MRSELNDGFILFFSKAQRPLILFINKLFKDHFAQRENNESK